MSEIYKLSNWINAVKLKNIFNSSIKVDILQLKDNQGYILTVFEMLPNGGSNTLYRVPVECTLDNNWSLSTSEAISMLNTLGFPCEWVDESSISMDIYKVLVQLNAFGWKKVLRSIRPARVYLIDSADISHELAAVIPNSKYSDWKFLTVNIPTSIEELLDVYAYKEDDNASDVISEEEPTQSE